MVIKKITLLCFIYFFTSCEKYIPETIQDDGIQEYLTIHEDLVVSQTNDILENTTWSRLFLEDGKWSTQTIIEGKIEEHIWEFGETDPFNYKILNDFTFSITRDNELTKNVLFYFFTDYENNIYFFVDENPPLWDVIYHEDNSKSYEVKISYKLNFQLKDDTLITRNEDGIEIYRYLKF